MDDKTLELLAEMICGDGSFPKYRTGSELTRFFQHVGFSNFRHDGRTRKWWTLDVLRQLTKNNLKAVILRLADPREYNADSRLTAQAISALNDILGLEGIAVELDGVTPRLKEVTPHLVDREDASELKPLPPPDFLSLKLEPGLGEVLSHRWEQAQKCVNGQAYLAAIIMMGSLLEGMMLAVMQRFPQHANSSPAAPLDPKTGSVKRFWDWTLSDMHIQVDPPELMGYVARVPKPGSPISAVDSQDVPRQGHVCEKDPVPLDTELRHSVRGRQDLGQREEARGRT